MGKKERKKKADHIWKPRGSYLYEEKPMSDMQNITARNFVTIYQQRRHYTPAAVD
jgi:hypothetical protein